MVFLHSPIILVLGFIPVLLFSVMLIVYYMSRVAIEHLQFFGSYERDHLLKWAWDWVSFQYWQPNLKKTVNVNS
jgi:hypothetical protein